MRCGYKHKREAAPRHCTIAEVLATAEALKCPIHQYKYNKMRSFVQLVDTAAYRRKMREAVEGGGGWVADGKVTLPRAVGEWLAVKDRAA